MQWNSLSEFINMGGYGFYVWGSYGVTVLLLGGELFMLWKHKRDLARRATVTATQSDAQLDAPLQGVQ
jgi:heme exporter protein D